MAQTEILIQRIVTAVCQGVKVRIQISDALTRISVPYGYMHRCILPLISKVDIITNAFPKWEIVVRIVSVKNRRQIIDWRRNLHFARILSVTMIKAEEIIVTSTTTLLIFYWVQKSNTLRKDISVFCSNAVFVTFYRVVPIVVPPVGQACILIPNIMYV